MGSGNMHMVRGKVCKHEKIPCSRNKNPNWDFRCAEKHYMQRVNGNAQTHTVVLFYYQEWLPQ